MIHKIENGNIEIAVSTKGAELQHLTNKETGTDIMWSGNPAFWAKKSPVLFPIVGTLKNNTYFFKNKSYQLGRHGFARDKEFELKIKSDDSLLFTLTSNDETKAVYPFDFEFSILYSINEKELSVTYIVENTGDHEMYFSVGGHPAFRVPLFHGEDYSDYILEFDKKETAGRWPISPDGLIESEPDHFFNNTNILPLTKELFLTDAIVLKNLNSESVKLISNKHGGSIRFNFEGFPYLGIWAAKNADFVCIEPWCGIADSVNTDQLLATKEGINKLDAANIFKSTWSVTFV